MTPPDHDALPDHLAGYRGRHDGESVVVCGCGTSLTTLIHPERFVTIGVNDVGRLFQPDYLVVVNPRNQFQGDRFHYVEQSQAHAVFSHLDLRIPHPHVVRFKLGTRSRDDNTNSNPNALHYTRNSPYVAMCLAKHMGARRIGVIGVDFTDGHFFAPTGTHALARQLPQMENEYRQLYEAFRCLGVEVFNLASVSRLTAFPKISISEFAAMTRKERPLRIVSYATTPVAGVPSILARSITARTPHTCRTVWATKAYGNGVTFEGDVEWRTSPLEGCVAIGIGRFADRAQRKGRFATSAASRESQSSPWRTTTCGTSTARSFSRDSRRGGRPVPGDSTKSENGQAVPNPLPL